MQDGKVCHLEMNFSPSMFAAVANDYDRILRENFGAIFLSLSEKYLGFKAQSYRDLPSKLHLTLEREPDFLQVIVTESGETFILHLEFQLQDNPNMLKRMRTYHAILSELHNLPIRQHVFYLGQQPPRMQTTFAPAEVMRGFNLVSLQAIDAQRFLESNIPEEVILAVLADHGPKKPKTVLSDILGRVLNLAEDPNLLRKMMKQLGILSRIPKLEGEYKKLLKEMPISIDVSKDIFFIEGKESGLEEGRREMAHTSALRMLHSGLLSHDKIAEFTGLSQEEVSVLDAQI